jgi:CIC family chloride channel protein
MRLTMWAISVSAVKAFASALRIGSGGSVGREGPIVQIGSALGSFSAVVLASVTASMVGRGTFGDTAFLHLPLFAMRSPVEYLSEVLTGLPVLVPGNQLVGWITHQPILNALDPTAPT